MLASSVFLTPKFLELETFKAAAAHKKSTSANEKQDFEICIRGIVQYRFGRRVTSVLRKEVKVFNSGISRRLGMNV